MFLDGEDFKSVWQLAHNWAGDDPNKTDVKEVSPKLKTAIHRLMHAMAIRDISARSSKRLTFEDNSLWTFITDFIHGGFNFQVQHLTVIWCNAPSSRRISQTGF